MEDFVDFRDYLKFESLYEIYLIVVNCYDFANKKFIFLPFDGGYCEQEDKNPILWQKMNYMIYKILKEK